MDLRLIHNRVYYILLLAFFLLSVSSCHKDNSDPLRIAENASNGIEDNVWVTYYPNNNQECITITGGERPYTVSCNSDILKVNMDKWPNAFNYEVLGVGEAEVKISDATGEFIILKVKIDYRSWNMRISKTEACVIGDQMTVAAQKELKEKALLSIPVKEGGGYKFIYTAESSGIVYVYTDQFGGDYQEGKFVYSYYKFETFSYPMYKIVLEEQERTLIVQRYYPVKTRSDMMVPVGLYEDLTEQYKKEYPEVEKVYTVQVINTKSE